VSCRATFCRTSPIPFTMHSLQGKAGTVSKLFEARTLAEWRKWLADNHDSESEVWLVFYKLASGRTSISYQDALDEALCYGWVDSLIKRLDDARYVRKFTPRKPDSRWSDINRKRYEELEADGRLMPPGLKRPPTDRRYDPKPQLSSEVPKYIQDVIRKNRKAWNYFESLPPSHRRMYVFWIDSAKREETKVKRLEEAIRMLGSGQKLGLK